MRSRFEASTRRGGILPMLVFGIVALLGFVALAVDVGMIAVTRTQTQNAADAAAMAGARALNGDTSAGNNVSGATPTALATIGANVIQAVPVQASQVQIQVGSYTYNYSSNKFEVNISAATTSPPNLAKATVNSSTQNVLGRLLGTSAFNTSATATAVHRPRDVAVILDMSGSMRFDSLIGIPYSGDRTQSNNPETVFPGFGHYSSSSLVLRNASGPDVIGSDTYGLSNITVDTDAGTAIVNDFHQSALGAASPSKAFTAAPDSFATTPGGDNYLRIDNNPGSGYAKHVRDITGSTSKHSGWESEGYPNFTDTDFNGFTRGPSHWGKTFFIWPPDPREDFDWRQRFFNPASGTLVDNQDLWTLSGNWRAPGSTTYSIDYTAILDWIRNTGPNPFPAQLRAGRILYYDAIPNTINTAAYPPTNPNERFWKEYIDYVLGLYQRNSTTYDVITPMTGYGDDFTWGTVRINGKPSDRYMDYQDNPKRPKLHFWFGPMTMIDFLGNYNLSSEYGSNWTFKWPGNCHEGPLWACKLGVQAALQDIENNHPNDFVSLIYFNTPKNSASDTGAFNRTRVPLGRDYTRMNETLWFPPSTIGSPGTEIRPYNTADNSEVPRASGGTTTVMGFMLAFNQFSSNTSLRSYAPSPAPAGEAGGLGRKGAQRLIILQTDGMANALASASFTNSGAYNSYYRVRMPGEYPGTSGSSVTSQIYSVVNQICALDTASSPGYSTKRKPVLIHCIGLGPLFDPSSTNPSSDDALALLQNIQTIGSVQSSASTPLESYKIITGTSAQRTDRIRQAFSAIMQDGVQVSLIQ